MIPNYQWIDLLGIDSTGTLSVFAAGNKYVLINYLIYVQAFNSMIWGGDQ